MVWFVSSAAWAADSLRYIDHPLAGRIFDVNASAFISEETLMERLRMTRYALVGEKHDNSEHHSLENRILQTIGGGNTRVVFEMLDESQSAGINLLSSKDSSEGIRQKLQWNERSWPWEDYGPLVHAAVATGSQVVAGNIDRKRIRALYEGNHGELEANPSFASLDVLDPLERESIREQLFVSHCEMMPREALDPMITIQAARDASMAHAMLHDGPNKGRGQALLVAGGFHVRHDIGVPRHLRYHDPEAEVTVIQLVEVQPDISTPSGYAAVSPDRANYVWFTPAAPEEDYCAGFHAKKSPSTSEK